MVLFQPLGSSLRMLYASGDMAIPMDCVVVCIPGTQNPYGVFAWTRGLSSYLAEPWHGTLIHSGVRKVLNKFRHSRTAQSEKFPCDRNIANITSGSLKYSFLDKSVGLSSLFEISRDSVVDDTLQIVEACHPLHVPGFESLIIPIKTRGYVLKVINGNTALVRWEELYLDSTEEVLVTLDLLSRLVTFNAAVCSAFMEIGNSLHEEATPMNGQVEKYAWINFVQIICTLVKNHNPNCDGVVMMSLGVNILAKMLKCSPSIVTIMVLKANIFDVASRTNPFDVGSNGLSR
ncbi:unnamed protein product [Ilex paraguariensis]|uniref:Uncharacterized protein n=1 Tax=Ilex paraguariensis TaxID=185542 RepID=A0ABC8SZ87_9AQUA